MRRSNITFLQKVYSVIFIVLFCLIVVTPSIIRSNFLFIEEGYLEGLLIIALFIIGYGVILLYRKEINKITQQVVNIEQEKRNIENRLEDAFKYIGGVNVRIEAIKSVLADIKKYPANKKEMKQIMELLNRTALKVVDVDWILLRIVDIQKLRTMRESIKPRGTTVLLKHGISNKNLVHKLDGTDYTVVSSKQSSMSIKAFCVLPKIKLNEEQKIILQAIANQLEMLFIIFDSRYYKHREKESQIKDS